MSNYRAGHRMGPSAVLILAAERGGRMEGECRRMGTAILRAGRLVDVAAYSSFPGDSQPANLCPSLSGKTFLHFFPRRRLTGY
jgi:hypothetical protein